MCFVHHINRYRFQCSLYSYGKCSKIFSGYLLIQSILRLPTLDNMKDIFNMCHKSGLLVVMVNFRARTSSQEDLAFTLFCEGSPSCRNSFPLGFTLFLTKLTKCSRTNEANFSAFILPWYYFAAIIALPYAIATIK